jgi:hypothetical protein
MIDLIWFDFSCPAALKVSCQFCTSVCTMCDQSINQSFMHHATVTLCNVKPKHEPRFHRLDNTPSHTATCNRMPRDHPALKSRCASNRGLRQALNVVSVRLDEHDWHARNLQQEKRKRAVTVGQAKQPVSATLAFAHV